MGKKKKRKRRPVAKKKRRPARAAGGSPNRSRSDIRLPIGCGPAGFWGSSKALLFFAEPLIARATSDEAFHEALEIGKDLWNALIPDGAMSRTQTIARLRPRCEALCGDAIPFEELMRRLRLRFYHANPRFLRDADPPVIPAEMIREVFPWMREGKKIEEYSIGTMDEALLETVLPDTKADAHIDDLERRLNRILDQISRGAPSTEDKLIFIEESHRFILEESERYLRAVPHPPDVVSCHMRNFEEYLEGFLEASLAIPISLSSAEDVEHFLLDYVCHNSVLTGMGETIMPFSLLFLYNFCRHIGLYNEIDPILDMLEEITPEYSRLLEIDRGLLRFDEKKSGAGKRRAGETLEMFSDSQDGYTDNHETTGKEVVMEKHIRQVEAARIKGVSTAAVSQAIRLGTLNTDPVTRRVICDKKFESWLTRRKNQYA